MLLYIFRSASILYDNSKNIAVRWVVYATNDLNATNSISAMRLPLLKLGLIYLYNKTGTTNHTIISKSKSAAMIDWKTFTHLTLIVLEYLLNQEEDHFVTWQTLISFWR